MCFRSRNRNDSNLLETHQVLTKVRDDAHDSLAVCEADIRAVGMISVFASNETSYNVLKLALIFVASSLLVSSFHLDYFINMPHF